MPQMKSLRSFRLATTKGFVAMVIAGEPFFCPDMAVEDAMGAGCVPVDENDLKFAEATHATRVDFAGNVRSSTLYLAISMVAKENDVKNFDGGGTPKLDVISKMVGFQVSPAELRDLYQQYQSNTANDVTYDLHPQAQNIMNVLAASTKAELAEMCAEFGIDEAAYKGRNMNEMRKLLLVKFNGAAQD